MLVTNPRVADGSGDLLIGKCSDQRFSPRIWYGESPVRPQQWRRKIENSWVSAPLLTNVYLISDSFSHLTFLEWLGATRALFEQCLSSSNKRHYLDPIEAFARTLFMNDLYTGSTFTGLPQILEPIQSYTAAIKRIRDQVLSAGTAITAMEDEVDTCIFQMTVACRYRKFSVTEKGYIGLVPGNAEVGDKIFIPLGSTVPFVIREGEGEQGTFELLGDAYIHGIMDGEEMEKENVRVDEILLC